MNEINTAMNLIILANSLDTGGGSGTLPFPHAWAALIWFAVTVAICLVVVWPWSEWSYMIDQYPITQGQRERNAVYRRKINILLGCALLVSVLAAVIPLSLGL
jgi:hypothetical protein